MAHKEQIAFCKKVRKMFPYYFLRSSIIDVGSLDINGNNRYLFRWPKSYIGLDIVEGKNVDMVGRAHVNLAMMEGMKNPPANQAFKRQFPVDVVISTEMLEHDEYWEESLKAMYSILRPNGLLLITAAGEMRPVHGTAAHHPDLSPGTNNYYRNISNEMFQDVLRPSMFKTYFVNQDWAQCDFQFYGIKKST